MLVVLSSLSVFCLKAFYIIRRLTEEGVLWRFRITSCLAVESNPVFAELFIVSHGPHLLNANVHVQRRLYFRRDRLLSMILNVH